MLAFLTTRVKEPTYKYFKKLVRMLTYLKVTPEKCLTISVEDTKLIKWWVDGSYSGHDINGGGGAVLYVSQTENEHQDIN